MIEKTFELSEGVCIIHNILDAFSKTFVYLPNDVKKALEHVLDLTTQYHNKQINFFSNKKYNLLGEKIYMKSLIQNENDIKNKNVKVIYTDLSITALSIYWTLFAISETSYKNYPKELQKKVSSLIYELGLYLDRKIPKNYEILKTTYFRKLTFQKL